MSEAIALVVLAVLLWPATPGSRERLATEPAQHRTAHRRWPRSAPRRRPRADEGWVADLAEVVVVGLDAGLGLPHAVLTAARSPTVAQRVPWLGPLLADAVASGGSVAHCLAGLAEGTRSGGAAPSLAPGEAAELGVLVRAWRLSERAGAAASMTSAAAAGALRARRADRERARSVAAGPRASMGLLTTLPLLGPAVGLLVGVSPDRLYGSGAARAGAVAGLLLTAAGWAWARRVLQRAGRAATVGRRAA